MKLFPRIAAIVATTALVSATVATPALAARVAPDADEQDLEISEAGCYAGWQATGLYHNLYTHKVEFTYDDGTNLLTATCTFRGIPRKVDVTETAEGSENWYRPAPGTTRFATPCGLFGPEYESHPDFDFDHGLGEESSTLTYTRGGTVVAICTWDLGGQS